MIFKLISDTLAGFKSQKSVLYKYETPRSIIDEHRAMAEAQVQSQLQPGEFCISCGLTEREFMELAHKTTRSNRNNLERSVRKKVEQGARIVPIKVTVRMRYGLIWRHRRHIIALSEIWPAGKEGEEDGLDFELNSMNLLRLADSTGK